MHKFFLLVLLLFVGLANSAATTRTIKVSTLKGELTQALRTATKNLTARDTTVILFDKKGTYTIKGTIQLYCNLRMEGLDQSKTTLVFEKGENTQTFVAFPDIYHIAVYGTASAPLEVQMRKLTIKLKEHTGIWWTNNEHIAIEFMHCKKVVIEDVNSYMDNAVITNFDLRHCSNVTVQRCTISNFNNCKTGGCLWLRHEMSNVNITGNTFYKYGNDETIAIWGNEPVGSAKQIIKENISISGNTFYYGYYDNTKRDKSIVNDVNIAIYSDEEQSVLPTLFRNISIKDNTFNVNAATRRNITFTFRANDSHENISIDGNTINNYADNPSQKYYKTDFQITDLTSSNETIYIRNNSTTSDHNTTDGGNYSTYSHMILDGGKYNIVGNTLQCKGKQGVYAIWPTKNGCEVSLSSNNFSGLALLAQLSRDETINSVTINAHNNVFSGTTTLYCNNIKSLNLNFDSNVFNSKSSTFFLQEFAETGTVTFNNNTVNVSQEGGSLMQHWDTSRNLNKMNVTSLTVQNNSFNGVNNPDITKNFKKVGKRRINNNSF